MESCSSLDSLGNQQNVLIVSNKSEWAVCLKKLHLIPEIALISIRGNNDIDSNLKSFIGEIIELGCHYFICVGKFSESLHDYIDDVAVDIRVNKKTDSSFQDITTTWHDDETHEEICYLFLSLASTISTPRLSVAFLDDNQEQDKKLKETLYKTSRGFYSTQ